MASENKTSDELEREIEARRARIENRVDDISAKLSPGQLLDEALSYTRSGPGADFTRNLGRSVTENPLPVALAVASLGWLAIQSNLPKHQRESEGLDDFEDDRLSGYDDDEDDYPLAMITGNSITRTGTSEQEGNRYAEFADTTGRKFKALSDETGQRAGHFTDETGKMFRGFIDNSGHRVSDFRDEAGNRLQQASHWAAHNWRKAGKGASKVGRSMRKGAGHMGEQVQRAGHGLQSQGRHAAHAADDFIHQQPLVSGAIAFAVGALLGGTLPHTRQEDEAFGSTADSLKKDAGRQAEHLYEKGRQEAGHLYEETRQAAGSAYEKTKESVGSGVDDAKTTAEDTALNR